MPNPVIRLGTLYPTLETRSADWAESQLDNQRQKRRFRSVFAWRRAPFDATFRSCRVVAGKTLDQEQP